MKFADIPGHQDIKARLAQMVDENRVPHALLLEGPSGTAKYMLARALARYIHCTDRQNGDSCGRCPSCLQHDAHSHIDLLYSFPVIKKDSKATISDDFRRTFIDFMTENPFMDFNRWPAYLDNANTRPVIYVDEGNELLRRLSYTSHASKFKVVLMWLPERLQEDAANKMLKLLEEPTDDTLFILCSDESRRILPTIYSRVQRVKVRRYENEVIADYLQRAMKLSATAAADVAAIAEGDMNRAQDIAHLLMDEGAETPDAENLQMFIRLMRLAWQRDIAALKKWSADVASLKREGIIRFLNYSARMLRENFILNLGVDSLNRLTAPERNFSVNFARFIHERNVLKLFEEFNLASGDIAANGNAKIILLDLAISVILLLKD